MKRRTKSFLAAILTGAFFWSNLVTLAASAPVNRFDEGEYRALTARMQGEEPPTKASLPTNAAPEQVAAWCHAVRSSYMVGRCDVETLFEAAPLVQQLLVQYPESTGILTLRMAYGLVEEHRTFSPFLSMAAPIVFAIDQTEPVPAWQTDLEEYFYASIYAMWHAYALDSPSALQQTDEELGKRPKSYPRSFYIFSVDVNEPTEEDVVMWQTLVFEYAQRAPRHKKIWSGYVEKLNQFGIKTNTMSLPAARLRLARLLSGVTTREITNSVDERKVETRVSRAFTAGMQQGVKQKPKISRTSSETEVRYDELLHETMKPNEDWDAHRALCEFMAQNRMRDSNEYPPASYGPTDSRILLEAAAYYQLIVRAGLSRYRADAAERALELTSRAIEIDASSARAHALMAFAYLRKESIEEARTALKEAKLLDNEDPMVSFVENIVVRRTNRVAPEE